VIRFQDVGGNDSHSLCGDDIGIGCNAADSLSRPMKSRHRALCGLMTGETVASDSYPCILSERNGDLTRTGVITVLHDRMELIVTLISE
jgi:hypothetical protein